MAQNRCISCMNVIDSPVCPYCGYPVHNQTQPHQLPVGTMLRGRYQVGRVLGQGGFGITYMAWDTLMENVVAVKEFFPGSTVNRNTAYSPTVQCNTTNMGAHYEASKERFLREAKALVRFRNVPEVVDILDFMEENNTAYIVMEFVRGVDLAKYIQSRGGRLSVEETFRILKPVMEALATVHKGGIVHRDISPDNIILDPMGGAKLLDFGAVRSVDNPDVDKALNKSTEAILKQGFAPLEQYNTRGSLGPWTDEYAMCATVFYCLTGRIPEDASIRVTEGIDPDWDSIEGLPQHQKRALEKGMSVRAKDRYPDMDALMADLFAAPAAQPTPEPVSPVAPQAPVFDPTVAIGTPPVQPQPPVQPSGEPIIVDRRPKKKLWPILAAVAAVLVVAILAGILLPGMIAGKSGNTSSHRVSDNDDRDEDYTPAKPETEPASETPAIDEPVILSEPVTITWYTVGGGMPSNWESWTNTVNSYLEDKIGVHLNMQVVGWGDWATTRDVLVQTGADYDIMFAPGGDFVVDTSLGACAPLDEYLDACPGLTDLIPAAYLDACRVDGVLYGIPAYKDCSMTNYFVWSKDIVKAYYPDYANAHSLAEIYGGLEACVDGSGMIGLGLTSNGFTPIVTQNYDTAGLRDIGIGISYYGGAEFVPIYEQPEILAEYEILGHMYSNGLINPDAGLLSDWEFGGMHVVSPAQGWPSAAETTWGPGRGCEVVVSQYGDTVVSTDTVRGSVLTVNANSRHPLECMKLIELVNTDTKLRDMLWYGEEGINFEYVDENGIMKVSKLNRDWTMAAYTQGTFFNVTPEVGSIGYAEIQALNEQAIVSPAMGFTVDTSAIADKVERLRSIYSNYISLIATGTDISVIDDMMDEMRAAGFDAVLAEVNRQYDQWLANQ